MQIKLLMAIALLSAMAIVSCNNKENAASPVEAVAAKVEALRMAMTDPSEEKLKAITSTQLSYGHSSGKVEDQAMFIQTLTSGKSDFVEITLTDQVITVEGNTAVVRHQLEAKTNDGGQPGEVKLKIMLVFAQENGDWKLLARQAVKAI